MPGTRFLKPHLIMMTLAVLLLAVFMISLMTGSISIFFQKIGSSLAKVITHWRCEDSTDRILWLTRLPRIMLALLVGATMGMTGLASQTLFRNPLASPYIIGVSSGAAVGAVLGLLASSFIPYALVPVLSVCSGLMVSLFVFILAQRGGHFGQSLLLAGMAISAFCSSLTAGALYVAGERLQTLVFWLMGGLWQATWMDVLVMLPVCGICLIALNSLAPAMNVSLTGDRTACDLGVNIVRLQRQLLMLIAVATSVSVSLTGVIGFIGLVVPHLLRLAMGADHRHLMPATALGGALLLLGADTLARTMVAPAEIPVGIFTALIGAPVFLWMLLRHGAGRAGQ